MTKNNKEAQVVATIGPESGSKDVIKELIASGLGVARLNLSWGTLSEHKTYIANIREAAQGEDENIPIIIDLPGPRQKERDGHSVAEDKPVVTDKDRELIDFAKDQGVDYIAVSFVRSAVDIQEVQHLSGGIPAIAKIERQEALDNIEDIIDKSDAIMIARGDLGGQIDPAYLPFVQLEITQLCNAKNVPTITATEMLLSMTDSDTPTRAEITDVAFAAIHGSDALMLSEETATGSYPREAVQWMKNIVTVAEQFRKEGGQLDTFTRGGDFNSDYS